MSTQPKSLKQKVYHEIKTVAITTVYFAIWFGLLMFLKKMILTEYKVEFTNIAMALIGALILAKVVLVIDLIPLSSWTRGRSAVYFIFFRTLLNIIAVYILLLVEHAFTARYEYGGFGAALGHVFQHRDVYHIWANVTAVGISVFWFNVIFVLRQHLGEQKLRQLFFLDSMNDLLLKRTN